MSLADVFAPVEKRNREAVLHNTWGHLGPERGKHKGWILIAVSSYSGSHVVDDSFPTLPNSPWQYSALQDIMFALMKDQDVGVYRATGFLNWRRVKGEPNASELGHWKFCLEKLV